MIIIELFIRAKTQEINFWVFFLYFMVSMFFSNCRCRRVLRAPPLPFLFRQSAASQIIKCGRSSLEPRHSSIRRSHTVHQRNHNHMTPTWRREAQVMHERQNASKHACLTKLRSPCRAAWSPAKHEASPHLRTRCTHHTKKQVGKLKIPHHRKAWNRTPPCEIWQSL